jgi:hypothetical protein
MIEYTGLLHDETQRRKKKLHAPPTKTIQPAEESFGDGDGHQQICTEPQNTPPQDYSQLK